MVVSRVILAIILFFLMPVWGYAAPVIFPQKSVVGVTVAYITWTSSEASTSRVDYGETTAYGSNVTNGSSVTWHALTITGLTANTAYHYKITSGATESEDYTFTTYANPTGTVHTVGSGKDYETPQLCATASSSGWTCLVYSGDYGSVTSASNGVTFLAQEACTVENFDLSNRTTNQVKGFEIDSGSTHGVVITGATSSLIENNYIHPAGGIGIRAPDNLAPANNSIIRNNVIYNTGGAGATNTHAIQVYGDTILVDNNDISHCQDFIEWGGLTDATGLNWVIRNNVLHHADADARSNYYHIDGMQIMGGTTASYSLIENNIEYSCVDSTGNCHFVYGRNVSAANIDNIIVRYNFASNIDGSGMFFGATGDEIDNIRFYNNTMGTDYPGGSGDCAGAYGTVSNVKILNNICYNTVDENYSPVLPTDGTSDYNVAFNTGYSGEWPSPYSSETAYATHKNLNPTFTNYPYGSALASNSPVIGLGGALTTVHADDIDTGTSLIVADARWFQPGWAGVDADYICVGATVAAAECMQLSDINYGTNTITVADFTRAEGESVWLYKDSDGTRVLYGTAPEVGAYEDEAPTILSVNSDHANGTYSVDEVIDIDVYFSEVVTSDGNVTVTLETGDTDRTCTFTVTSAASGTCNYTVQAGDISVDLTVKEISGTIQDVAENAMEVFTPTTNLAANKDIVIQTDIGPIPPGGFSAGVCTGVIQ